MASVCGHGVLLLAGLWLALGSGAANPWPRPVGETYTRTEVEGFRSGDAGTEFSQLVVREYVELGLGDVLTLGGQVANMRFEAQGPGYHNIGTGVSEAELFASVHRPADGRLVSAWRATGGFPTAKFIRGQRAMGQDAFIGIDRLWGLGSERLFSVVEAGVRSSLGDDAVQLRVGAKIGFKRGRSMLIAESRNVIAVSEAHGQGNDFDLGQMSVSAVLPLTDHFQVELGGRADTYIRNIDRGQAVFFAVWLTL
ncbi:MAG: hypothetical protein AAGH41_05040 [Pseudomonadota bacterium]